MYLYKAFGISIESEVLIPQFINSNHQQAEVSITFGKVRQHLAPLDKVARAIQISEREIGFYWKQSGWFLVRNGNEIIIEAETETDEKLLIIPLVGIVLATLLHQRRMLVLHASTVNINGRGATFLGQKGKGKSTTAALLYKRGHAVISDDITAIEFTEDKLPVVTPGFPDFKLLPDTISALGDDPNAFAECYDGAEKRYRSLSDNFLQNKIPLKSVFFLAEGDNLRLDILKPQEAVTVLIANTYLARYGDKLFTNSQVMANLAQCSNVVNHIPVYRLERPKSFHLMKDLAELIELHSDLVDESGVEKRRARR